MKIEYSADGNVAVYCGYKFRRDPKTGYYLCTRKTDAGRRERLHVYVWRKENGDIPDGHHIHHKDEDKRNNDLSNLECIPRFDHISLHSKERAEKFHDAVIRNLRENAAPKAAEWHKSDTGRKWHKENAFPVWEMEKTEHICTYCGKKYMSREVGHNLFCSNRCKAAARRKSGVDDETRTCAHCGRGFTANRYSTKRFCAAECRFAFRRDKSNQTGGETAGL